MDQQYEFERRLEQLHYPKVIRSSAHTSAIVHPPQSIPKGVNRFSCTGSWPRTIPQSLVNPVGFIISQSCAEHFLSYPSPVLST
jgi:hypothetical protein